MSSDHYTCDCGWRLPKGLQLLASGMDRVLVACGQCGRWWMLETSINGGWSLQQQGAKPGSQRPA